MVLSISGTTMHMTLWVLTLHLWFQYGCFFILQHALHVPQLKKSLIIRNGRFITMDCNTLHPHHVSSVSDDVVVVTKELSV